MRAFVRPIAAASFAVALATPLIRLTKLSATRSAVSMPRAGPSTIATPRAGLNRGAVIDEGLEADRGVDQAEGERGEVEAGDDAVLPGGHDGLRLRVPRGTMASVVRSPARPRSSSSASRTSGSTTIVGSGTSGMFRLS